MADGVPGLRERRADLFLVAFFLLHVPTTALIDSQCLLPAEVVPPALRAALRGHIETNKDVLMATCPFWFQSLVACELLFQLPFFFVAAYGFAKARPWVRASAMVYGAHTVTTMVPILSHFWGPAAADAPAALVPTTVSEKLTITLLYLPWLAIPLWLTLRMASGPYPAPAPAGKAKRT